MSTGYFNVNPRYTPGSPAQVDGATATRVAMQEQNAHDDALKSDDECRVRAESLGLAGIVTYVVEQFNGAWVSDVIIGSSEFKPNQKKQSSRLTGPRRPTLTLKELKAVNEALAFRLAGDIEEEVDSAALESAHDKVKELIARKARS